MSNQINNQTDDQIKDQENVQTDNQLNEQENKQADKQENNQGNKKLALIITGIILVVAVVLCLIILFSSCDKDDSDDSTASVINSISNEEDTTEYNPYGVVWPDRGSEMQEIIDAVIMARTENPDIDYNVDDPESFWTLVYYTLVQVGEDYGLATDEDDDGKYEMEVAEVKVYARIVFNAYDGTLNLPTLPDDFEGIEYDESTQQYSYWDTGLTFGKSEVYACGEEEENKTYTTVSYYIDGEGDDTVIVPWKVMITDQRTSDSDNPIYAYRISGMEKVEDFDMSTTEAQ